MRIIKKLEKFQKSREIEMSDWANSNKFPPYIGHLHTEERERYYGMLDSYNHLGEFIEKEKKKINTRL